MNEPVEIPEESADRGGMFRAVWDIQATLINGIFTTSGEERRAAITLLVSFYLGTFGLLVNLVALIGMCIWMFVAVIVNDDFVGGLVAIGVGTVIRLIGLDLYIFAKGQISRLDSR